MVKLGFSQLKKSMWFCPATFIQYIHRSSWKVKVLQVTVTDDDPKIRDLQKMPNTLSVATKLWQGKAISFERAPYGHAGPVPDRPRTNPLRDQTGPLSESTRTSSGWQITQNFVKPSEVTVGWMHAATWTKCHNPPCLHMLLRPV